MERYTDNYVAEAAQQISTTIIEAMLNYGLIDGDGIAGGTHHDFIEMVDQIIFDSLTRFHNKKTPTRAIAAARSASKVEGATKMKTLLSIALLFCPHWILEQSAGWAPRDSAGAVVHDDRLHIMGGWVNTLAYGPRDVWSTEHPGAGDWQMNALEAEWQHGDFSVTLSFQGKIWQMGGWYGGRNADASASNEIWNSEDGGETWEFVRYAPWSARTGAAGVVHNGRMWVIAGTKHFFDAGNLLSDVWSSCDGTTWIQHSAQFPARAFTSAVSFKGKMYLIGGGSIAPGEAFTTNDVWSTVDGNTWTEEPTPPWDPRMWHSAVSYCGKLWVLYGWTPNRNHGDVWYTPNGKTWVQLGSANGPSARHAPMVAVFKNQLWLIGGKDKQLRNDVWRLNFGHGCD